MKYIECSCESLQKPVRTVSGIVEKNQSLQVLSNILVECNNKKVTFSTTDLDIQIKTESEIGLEGVVGSFTISAQKLGEILNEHESSDVIQIEIESDGRATLKSPSGLFHLQTLPVRDFPVIKTGKPHASFRLESNMFRHLLACTSFAMASRDIRYYLNGVLLEAEGNHIRTVATDTHRLAYYEIELPTLNQEQKVESIIPRKTVRELLRILPDDKTEVSIEISDTQIVITFDEIQFISKLIEGKFPDYTRVMPSAASNPQKVSINREDLIRALRRVSILTNEKFHGVRWFFHENHLTLQGTNSEQEEANQEFELEWPWADLDIGFNITYLLEALNILSNEKICFHFASTQKSVLLTMPESLSFKYVIMPMRI